jgi:hypothetical protein
MFTIMQETPVEVLKPESLESLEPAKANLLNRFLKIAHEEASKFAESGRYCRRFARRQWRQELGDTFRFRGKFFKGGGYVHSFRTWVST